MPYTYIVEHLEAQDTELDTPLPKWVILEYRHIVQQTKPSVAAFTSLTDTQAEYLSKQVNEDFISTTKSVHVVMKEKNIPLERVCLLDPKATQEIAPEDSQLFDCFLFGGILGDDPPRDRTAELRKFNFPGRHLGSVQMTTDTAVKVTKRVVEGQQKLGDINFSDFPTIKFNKYESVEMPFRYIVGEDGNPFMADGMLEHLKEDDVPLDLAL